MITYIPSKVRIAAHRGVSGANIPCNTKPAFAIALTQGCNIVELDVTQSRDGKLFVFHPGMEKPHLNIDASLADLTAAQIGKLRYVNQDNVPTSYAVTPLEDMLTFLKDKAYINVDKYWENIEDITEIIRYTGVEQQVIVKTPPDETYLDQVEQYAPDLAYMAVVRGKDTFTQYATERHVTYFGVEALFASEQDEVVSKAYINSLHRAGLLLFGNAIVYDESQNISAGHTDDVALAGNADFGWGWFVDKGFDIIQTDWCIMMKRYLQTRGQ